MSNGKFSRFERNRYFYGKLLTVRDFEIEQEYHNLKRAMLNRLVTGAGVVCGLGVTASDESTLMIESGFAIDYQGREIVLPEAVFRKLQMLDGHETLLGKADAYLCVEYDEKNVEPVNATGAQAGFDREYDLTREGYRLYLTAGTPDYKQLLGAAGRENVSVLYQSEDLTLVLSVPGNVCAGEEFEAQVLVIKNENTPPVRFSLEGENTFAQSDNSRIRMEFQESRQEKRCVYTVDFPFRAKNFTDVESRLFPTGCELNVELGDHHYKNYLTVDADVYLCADEAQKQARARSSDSLERHTAGGETPVYLAKLELIRSSGGVFVGSVTNLPFGQTVVHESETRGQSAAQLEVTASARSLEYWQMPDVKAVYTPSSGGLHFDFGIPSPEQYDDTVARGTVDIALPGGLRVNSRVMSEEIAHGLGVGAVDVRLSVEFRNSATGENMLLCGSSEVFKEKNLKFSLPWVETAAVVYPERGTMRIGLWLHDTVEGNKLTVHYFVQKAERDAGRMISQRKTSISITPEFSRLSCRGKLQFTAEVTGGEDKSVIWEIAEEDGGAIDRNGLYQAPELPGTYEIVAKARADETVKAIAFVIVE